MAKKKEEEKVLKELAEEIKVKSNEIIKFLNKKGIKNLEEDFLIDTDTVKEIKKHFKELAKKKNNKKKSVTKKEKTEKDEKEKKKRTPSKSEKTGKKKKTTKGKAKEVVEEEENKEDEENPKKPKRKFSRIEFSREEKEEEKKIEIEEKVEEEKVVEEIKKEERIEEKIPKHDEEVKDSEKVKGKQSEVKPSEQRGNFNINDMQEVEVEKKETAEKKKIESQKVEKKPPFGKKVGKYEKHERKDFRYKGKTDYPPKFEEVKPIVEPEKKFVTSEEITKGKKGKKKKVIDQKVIEKSIQKTIKAIRAGELSHKKKYKEKPKDAQEKSETKRISISDFIVLSDLAERINLDPVELIEKGIELGLMVTINQRIDFETASLLLMEFGYDVEKIAPEIEETTKKEEEEEKQKYELIKRPPVITIMGHVDHGKTTLIDFLRKSRITDSEYGKITQDLGAYTVNTKHGLITILDTPGHEAFTAMRARGAQITDIAVIVIAANDGVQPQTIEAINHCKLANVPIIIAINKIDLPESDINRVKRELLNINVILDEFGGNVPVVAISAKTGKNVDELLETIAIQAELLDLKAPYEGTVKGTVIEIKQDKGLGAIFNCIIQKGSLKKNDFFVVGKVYGKVRKMLNEFKQEVKQATPGIPIMIVGANELPEVGDILTTVENEKIAKDIARERYFAYREQLLKKREITSLDGFEKQLEIMKKKELNIIIKGKSYGSIEALADSLQMLSNEDAIVNVVLKDVGIVTENDVNAAIASKGMIIAFDTSVDSNARTKAKSEGIIIKQYNVIYDVIDDIKNALKSFKEVVYENKIIGTAEVRELFKISRLGTIAGLYVLDGKIVRNSMINILRNGNDLGSYSIKTLKRFKDDVKEVEAGYECAVLLDGFDDIEKGDIFKCIIKVEKKD
ncbi:MAG: Translation initiation factor IF-2 [candidate division TA06 bacterium 32_111]|uniref:Translation initiation factor IF-2 n=2 Tax=Bacteria candidate phyla TaxID=1783234 RepID=A0A101I3L0_UNCT6|nr:MAG: Translation initiation factor IF-2 [candidate division TA06 bacterium 32_111]KUK88025.1 MAG: Translation initiation factor IF-2 [candidate division TA06 bacterium 34_109]HAF06953.1 translation initiation factor IF-2 [candidate division WOR-3 bacterium]